MSSPSGNGSATTPKPKPRVVSAAGSAHQREELTFWDPKTLCGLVLSQVSELTEQYMRSPAFLLWLRYSVQFENLCSRWIARAQSIQTPASAVPNRPQ